MSEDVRTELRRDFLKVLSKFEGKQASVALYGRNSNKQESAVLAFDRETLHMIVSPWNTPTEKRSSAILRLTDVESVTIKSEEK